MRLSGSIYLLNPEVTKCCLYPEHLVQIDERYQKNLPYETGNIARESVSA